jgi:hypothetical protein
MPTDSFTSALERLDPASRALLDLSLRRGMRTEEIAEVLGAEPESVEASRDAALRRIATDVGMPDAEDLDQVRTRLAELPAEQWLGNGKAPVEEPVAEEPAEPVADKPKRRGSVWPLLLGLLLTAGVIVAIALGTSDNGNPTSTTAPRGTAPAPAPPKAPKAGQAAKLIALGATGATGTAKVSGGRLTLRARGLPAGHYEVWLYNSILDTRSIATANGRRISVTAKLPGGWKRFRFVDISRERRDGNLSHSGESVLRVPTKTLSRR